VALAEVLDSGLDQRKSAFVVCAPVRAKVPKVCTEQDVRSCVVGIRTQVMRKILRLIMIGAPSPNELVTASRIDTVATSSKSRHHVIHTITLFARDTGDVDQAIIRMERVGRESKQHVSRFCATPNHRLADGERQQPVLNAGCASVVDCELVEVNPCHGCRRTSTVLSVRSR
jgi:hypothetical protein